MQTKGFFVKKPIPVFAEQWWPGSDMKDVEEIRHTQMGSVGKINLKESYQYVSPGCYIISKNNDIWAVQEDIFKDTYIEYNS